MKRAFLFLIICLLFSGCSPSQTGQKGSNVLFSPGSSKSKDRQIEKLTSTVSTASVSLMTGEATSQAQKKEAALDVLQRYLDAVIKGGDETNWDLSTEAAHAAVLKQFSPAEQDKEHFLKMFCEGVAHEQLLSYTLKKVDIYGDQAQVLVLTTRKNKAEPSSADQKTYGSTDTYKLILTNGQWKVDWTIGGTFSSF